MSSDSGEDSDGEDLCTIRPSLIKELRNVLDLYPDDGQILKELIQNAEDAQATEVKVLTDKRCFHQDLDPGTLKKHPHLKFFQGPALCVYNNAKFTDDDWKGIRMLHTSVKEKDPLKVGRFGLGFKSVFHLTDRLVILSGDFIMYMDPFKGEDRYCKRHRITGRKKREVESIMKSLEGVFGVSRGMFQKESGGFSGTLFWFPLRQAPSELSSTVYAEDSVDSLLTSFKAEASSLPIFLNHILCVSLLSRDGTSGPEELFSVGVASSSLREVLTQREGFVREIRTAQDGLPENEVVSLTEVVMETTDHLTSSKESRRWLVVNYHSGRRQASRQLLRLCSDPQLSYRPYVGVAIPLSNQSDFQSQIFCFLPLPLDTRSPTGLPIHVHGYFALEQNRRHLKWPAADQRAQLDPPSLWNCLLVTELLPKVYCMALLRLQELSKEDPQTFYAACPDADIVHDRWRPLLEPLYISLVQRPVFYSHVQNGSWVLIRDAVMQRFGRRFSAEVEAAVVKVYTISEQKLVDLPDPVQRSLEKFGLLKGVEVIQAMRVSQLLPHCLPRLCRTEKLSLLHYLYCLNKQLLLDQALLPLADGTSFATFKVRASKKGKKDGHVSLTHWCPEELVTLFPGLETEFCDHTVSADIADDLRRFAESGISSLDHLHKRDPRIPGLLRKSLQTRFHNSQPTVDSSGIWIKRVWNYLAAFDDLSAFRDVPLLAAKACPLDSSGDDIWKLYPLDGVYVSRRADGFSPLPLSLASALTKLRIIVLEELPDYIARHGKVLGNFVNYPSSQGVMSAVRKTDAVPARRSDAIACFNASATEKEKKSLLQFLYNCRDTEGNLPTLFRHLKLFSDVLSKERTSVDHVSCVGPENLPPISVSTPFLLCNMSERHVAVSLGATEMTLADLVCDIMDNMLSGASQYSQEEVIQFMAYFLRNKKLLADTHLLSLAREVQFIRTVSGQLERAEDLYDPTSSLLRDLFCYQQHSTLFPVGEFAQSDMLKKLKKLGLRSEKDVKAADLINSAKKVSDRWGTKDQTTAKKIADGLFSYLKNYGHHISDTTLETIATVQCLPCVQEKERPRNYPKSLPLKSCPALVKPAEASSHRLMNVTGSVVPVLRQGMDEEVVSRLQMITEARPDDVLQHLRNVQRHFQQKEASQYECVLKDILQIFACQISRPWAIENLRDESFVLTESGEKFATPRSFWIHRELNNDIDLKPYRFALPLKIALPVEMEDVRELLEECGSSENQNDLMLQSVLSEIQSKHCSHESSHPNFRSDFQLVKRILDVLKRSDTACDGNTLLPIIRPEHTDVLRFMTAKDCTIMPGPSQNFAHADVGFEIHFVHPDVSNSTALDLGASLMKDRALTGVEDLDYGYGQYEDLTHRLSNLLKEAYTDGFSVPKELIQNADDAHATKVCFLLDERENTDSRSNLIDDEMASLQGPAIWAYNDAEFSDTDFENIVKLGSGTKKTDTTKVGRFGLGFNSVYNLTEVPCFFSKHKLAMFDPQVKYLGKGKGLLLDFTKAINKALLGRMPEQFAPFQGVFGCTLKSNTETYYRGTLFRFPLRTADQAVRSKLKTESYSETKRRDFLKMLLEKAGSLLMFTQSVKEIQVYHLPSHCSDPSKKTCLLTVSKNCSPAVVTRSHVQIGSKTILQYMRDNWSDQNKDIKLQQKSTIEMVVTKEARSICGVAERHCVTHWQLAWASGINRSANMAHVYTQEGLVPLAAVAISLSDDQLIPLKDNPEGFYNSGHLFCFLPLPEEMVRVSLPVHVNGIFALTSDRRSLLVQTEDDFEMGESSWNTALFGDPVVRAYLLLLELVRKEAATDADYCRYFELWPTDSMSCVVDSFYQQLQSDHSKVFPVRDKDVWVCFADAYFLQPEFRKSACGKVAFECLQKLWKGPGYLVDVPHSICKLMKERGLRGSFETKVITELVFYKDYFFPHLQDSWWTSDDRDLLIHHALMQNDEHISQLIKDNPCIPCDLTSKLRKPSELIHPHGQVAKLFFRSEGRFPQRGTKQVKEQDMQTPDKLDFCSYTVLSRLSALGMITDELPWEMVLERAGTVRLLNAEDSTVDESHTRASNLIEYLSSPKPFKPEYAFENCPQSVKTALSEIAFLPVCPKPDDWHFIWAGDGPADGQLLAPPIQLCSDSLKNLVSCSMKLLDTKVLKGSARVPTGKTKEVLKMLGLLVDLDYSDKKLLTLAVDQLITVADHCDANSSNNRVYVQAITSDVYNYLNRCLKQAEENDVRDCLHASLSERGVIWTGTDFVQPACVAFHCQYDCAPYLFQLEKSFHFNKLFFGAIGVKERFEADDVLSVCEQLYKEHSGEALTDDVISLVSRLAQLLAEIMKISSEVADAQSLDTSRVFLPDSHGLMQPASHLCVDDCEWLTESDHMKFVNGMIAPDVAQLLGVKSKKIQDFDAVTELIPMEFFGQSEKLTSRIERLLQGYTFDSSLWKELIQNADDAGATEAKLIMDFRNLGTAKVPEKWEVLQGPAFCFYNNRSFTREDMQGIQNLGVGSKAQDALKIGQFGVGFNAVFHITDVPSFWTREDDKKDVICVLDPNCQYVRNTKRDKPGVKFTNIERMKQQYPDFLSGYLSSAIDMSRSGTLFRFPLRTEQMAQVSEIKKEPVTEEMIKTLLQSFQEEMKMCLLFLNSLHKIGIYSVNEDGALELQSEVNKTIDDVSRKQVAHFRTSLQKASETLKWKTRSINGIETCEAVVHSELADSSGRSEQWLTVHRLGFSEGKELSSALVDEWSQKNFCLLPHGGVAVRLEEKGNITTQKPSVIKHQAFCSLPLPVSTHLPMHVNGHFALDHETRRNLWDSGSNKGDVKSEWNELVVVGIIVPAYVTALQHVKNVFFPADGKDLDITLKNYRLQQYHDLFPRVRDATSEIWKKLMQEVYITLAKHELPLFPVICLDQPVLEWLPVSRKKGFPGYFNNLFEYFREHMLESKPAKPVVLSQGVSTTSNSEANDESKARKNSEELKMLLKRANMKILEAPFRIHEDLKNSGVEDIQHVTPNSVLTFLVSSGQGVPSGCSIKNLPKKVSDTPLNTADNVKKLVSFVSKDPAFLDSLDGLPLCFRQSGTLHWFSSTESASKPIISKFSHLLPGSADEFLHENIRKFFQDAERTKGVLQKLDISMFASRLQHTLKDPSLRAAKPCLFDKTKFPSQSWLRDLWTFLETQLKTAASKSLKSELPEKDTLKQPVLTDTRQHFKMEGSLDNTKENNKSEEKEIRHKANKMLETLQNWCLIPVKKHNEKKRDSVDHETLMLYPLLDLHKVVYLPPSRDQSNGSLWTILKNLPLPFLDQVGPTSIANKLVASISHPRALLHALVSCADCLSESHGNGSVILTYFNSNLAILKDSDENETELKTQLRKLPVYPSIDGNLITTKQSVPVLCLTSSILQKGLCQWSQQRNSKLTLLREGFVPSELIKYLGFEIVSDAMFYARYLLPTIDSLPHSAITTHMEFLRETFFRSVHPMESMTEEEKQLCLQLKVTAFVQIDGKLHTADDFYSPHEPVFKVMCSPESFPPDPYSCTKWKGLMTTAGMVCDITDNMFLSFARAVERDGTGGITKEIVNKSRTLVSHMFMRESLAQSGLLLSLRSIQFLVPYDWMSTNEGIQLQKIVPSYCQRRLVSFDESNFEHNLHMLWSSSCIIDQDSDPRYFGLKPKTLKQIMSQLCLEEKAPKRKVLQHIKNICDRLGGNEGQDIFYSLQDNKRLLIVVMEKLYRYLDDNAKTQDLAALKQLKIICDIDKSQMLQPANVVIDLRLHEMITGHIEKAPHHFGRYFDLFKKLGASENVIANHYACVLRWLKERSGNEPLNVEELKTVKTAVEGLFRCLREGSEEQKKITVPDLYLPTEEKSLHKSTELVFKDDYLGERFQSPPDGMHFFLGFEKLKIKTFFAQDDMKRLPEQYRVVMLSEVVQEIIPDEILRTAEEASESNPIVMKLLHPMVTPALIRLVYQEYKRSNRTFNEETAKQLQEMVQNVSVKDVPRLKTVLAMNSVPVQGTERSKMSFTKSEHPQMAVVYISRKAMRKWSRNEEQCIHSLAIAILFVFQNELDSHLLHCILRHPDRAMRTLDQERIARCAFTHALDDVVFPPAGDFVPLKFHHHLNNSFFDFYTGEHVGYEVYDPDVDEHDDESSGTQEADNVPVYIYGIILREVLHPSAQYASRLTRRYCVDLGPQRGKVEVSVIKLYKFVRTVRSSSQAMVQHHEHPEEAETPLELRTVLKEIRSLLTEAWQLPDKKDRRHVVKRLVLQWHPDKNPGNEEFCTRVTQTILHYVKLLEKGKALPSDDEGGTAETSANDAFFSSSSSFSSSFFANMRERGRRHRSHYDAETSGGHRSGSRSGRYRRMGSGNRERNPQPGESCRWLRQAEADIGAARAAVRSCERGHNWICYLFHQAVEKALKAVLFKRDADSFDFQSHDLLSLAESVADDQDSGLVELARKLEMRIGPHERMRYPDIRVYPRVPAEVYKEDDVTFACDMATQILSHVHTLLQG